MKLLTNQNREALLRNGALTAQFQRDGKAEPDFIPVVKLFTPDASCTWLLTELDPDAPDIAFGLCDLGMGFPELGSVSISEIQSLRGKLGLPVERDRHFAPLHTISVYSLAARRAQGITEDPRKLEEALLAQREEHAGGVS